MHFFCCDVWRFAVAPRTYQRLHFDWFTVRDGTQLCSAFTLPRPSHSIHSTRQPPALQLLGWTFPAARENNLMDSILSIKKWKQNKNVIINHKKTQFKMISTHSWWSWASFGSDSIHFSLIQICVVVVVFRRLLINYIIFILNWMLCTKDQDCDIFRFKYIFSIHSWIPSWVAAGVCWLDSKRWGAETWRELNWSAVGE